MKKILFLGYNRDQTSLIDKIQLHKKNWSVEQTEKKIDLNLAQKFNSIISFGYKHIINREIIDNLKYPIINLHISFLPYNKGAHPNFWSFIENTPSGVTIHQVDHGVDTGKIIYQKKIDFELFKNKQTLTFSKTYKVLINEIENLFLENIEDIINQKFISIEQIGKGSYHSKKDLPKLLDNWEQNIYQTVLKYKELNKLKNIKVD
tara:strand:- start:503 stop:1117 length:615 start_codon:yes stop_codon:yes gene_type:complete